MKKITVILGTRPEAIKLAPVILALKKSNLALNVIHTGQHSDLADDVLDYFKIKPDIRLSLNRDSIDSEVNLLHQLLEIINNSVRAENPDLVMVQGDTSSALSGALTAHYNKIPVSHLEAGLRSFDITQPFPEETNRKLISHVADIHFAATASAKQNLLNEGIAESDIHITGNSVVDALKMILKSSELSEEQIREKYNALGKKLILLTTHRRENLGEAQLQIFKAVEKICRTNPDFKLIFPVHPNPEIRKHFSHLENSDNIELIEPLSYFQFVPLMAACDLILTDSGGIQEEAPALGIPVFVLRNKTERPELIDAGAGKLIGTETDRIINEVQTFIETESESSPIEIFGDGQTSARVVSIIENFLK